MLNDKGREDFDTDLEDEDILDANPLPGTEMLGHAIERDCGSGSFAEDGRQEILEDRVMTQIGSGNIAVEGPTEIGYHDDEFDGVDRDYLTDVGGSPATDRPGSEIGSAAMYGPSEIGSAAMYGPTEIGGPASEDGQSEIGLSSDVMAPFEGFMLEEHRIGDANTLESQYEIGAAAAADRPGSEIGAVAKVIEKARDNRQPAPPMRAVAVDSPEREEDDWSLTDVVIGAAVSSGTDPFPLLSQLLLRAGAATEPRYVRVDTEASYKQFRTENSPELAALAARLDAHMADPSAHDDGQLSSDLSDDVEDLVHIGAEAAAAEQEKRVELWMPKRFDGKVEAWREGDFVCASIALPGADGEVRICTSLEPIRKCVEEMSRHAAESGVPASTVVGVLPAMGCVLGAGTAIKEMAAAAPAILQRPEAAVPAPFMVRIEPKTSPNLAALAMLAWACKQGNAQACDEWSRLAEGCSGPVKQGMVEALQLVKAAA